MCRLKCEFLSYKKFFLPNLSERGPMKICPAASPIMPIVRLNAIKEGDVWKDSDIVGIAGK